MVSIIYILAAITKLLSIEHAQKWISMLLVKVEHNEDNSDKDVKEASWTNKIKIKRSVFNGLVLIEIILESFPQIIISLTNTLLSGEGFNEITIISLCVSTFVLLNVVWKIGYNICIDKRKDVKEWKIQFQSFMYTTQYINNQLRRFLQFY